VSLRVLAVTNAYPRTDEESVGRFVKEQLDSLAAVGVDVRLLHVDRTREGPAVYRRLGPRLRSALAEHEPEVVHVMYGGVMASVAARQVGAVPFVVSFCGNDLLGEGETRFKRRVVERYAIACSRRAARRADHVIVKSNPLREALPTGIDDAKISLLPNGVDLERFSPLDRAESRARLGWPEDRRHVLFPAGPSRPEKRYWLARAAVDALQADGGVGIELRVLENVSRPDVPIWLNASDAVLLTSTHEGSPNVVKEALACDVAVVSTDVGDVSERVAGVIGCAVTAATPEALAAGLQEAFAAGHVNGRDAVQPLALNRVAERLERIYESVLASP
jgi:glycosyltransferase involved in cell wall biosynthesis